MIPERSIISKSAKSVFFEEVNDIDIYIEDTAFGYEKIYSVLFSRVFEGKYKLEKVFPLGGRNEVVNQYNLQKNDLVRPSLFIIDGDLFILTGDTEQSQKGLYIIPFYCIENILLDPLALNCILDEEEPVKSKEVIIGEFNYTGWLDVNEKKLFDLFIEYAITFLINPTEQTVAYPVSNLVSSNDGYIDDAKLGSRISHLKKMAIEKVGNEKYQNAKNIVMANYEAGTVFQIDSVSGKDYLLPLLKTRFKSIVKTRIPDINFKLRLAKNCDILKIKESLSYIAC